MIVDVAYVVSHGFAARMVMQTNLLGKLVSEGLTVCLIAPDKDDVNLNTYCEKNGVQLYEFNPRTSFWTGNYAKARMYFLENINNNPALLEKYIYAKIALKGKPFFSRWKLKAFKIGHDLKEFIPFVKRSFRKREVKALRSQEAINFLEKLNPKVLISTYPVSYMESMLVLAAKEKSLKTVIHLLSWDNISCKGHFPQLADEYIAWGDIMKNELQEYYNVNEKDIHVCGVPHFDLHAHFRTNANPEKYLTQLGLDGSKPYVFFGMSSPRFAPKEIDIVEYLAKQIEKNQFGEDLQLIVRPHPQNIQGNMSDESWLPRLERLKSSRVGVDIPSLADSKMAWSMEESDMNKLSSLLAGAQLSLNSGSTLSIDSMMCGTPVVLTSFDGHVELSYWKSARRLIDYNHLKKLVALKGVVTCESFNSLESEMKKILIDRDNYSEVALNSVNQFCSTSGKGTANVITAIKKILQFKSRYVSS